MPSAGTFGRRRPAAPCSVMVLLGLACAIHPLPAQPPESSAAKRAQAAALFQEGRRLEALPLLEQLVSANGRDDQMLVALAASLVEHAATLTDETAAAQERQRASTLLQQAQALGNRSTLALNLSELLAGMPQDGALRFSANPAIQQAMSAGEAAFSSRDFKGAIAHYSQALLLDPKSYTATLFIANSHDRAGELAEAALWYERAMRLGPDIETAYRYYADMLARQGEMGRARTMLIHAAVAEPYNRMVWRELRDWATLNGTHPNEILVAIPAPMEQQPQGFQEPPQISAAWEAYRHVSARWQEETFKQRFPGKKQYRHSLLEAVEALGAAVRLLEPLSRDPAGAAIIGSDASASLLLKLHSAGFLEAYVLFSLGDRGIAQDYAPYRAQHRDRLEAYLDQFVVPQPGPLPSPP